uniref:PX domain-containing protein n=1 Tax=Globisporangium ultimum (strain ATCC 200006 / CBS 805.95 / DAOM BR144) TaxID=431595 RepID=K3WIF0_GLOUD
MMIDEESISVKITASKEVESGDPLASGGSAPSAGEKFTMYTVFVRNLTTDGKTVVRRRYSDFYKLRKELIELVAWNHCGFCEQYMQQISQYPFPRRRLLRSSRAAVVKERMDSLRLFLRHLLLCLMARSFDDCTQAREKIEDCILKSFLQIDNASTLFPNLSSKPQRPIEILQAKEEKRHQEQIKAAGLRTPSYGYTSQVDRDMGNPQVPQSRQVATDTCHNCLQKWTHCYCNEEQDSIYPVNMNPAQRQHQLELLTEQQQQPYLHRPHYPSNNHQLYNGAVMDYSTAPYQHRESYSSMGSDASRCSRCDRDWDNCYCCQQISPTASSVCTDR